jgi:hypothetical protein
MVEISKILIQAWERLISQYEKGLIILTNEKSLETYFLKNCENVLSENKLSIPIGRQKKFYGKLVDVWIGDDNPSVVELKIYHDPADWRESKGSTNTVETDLNFASGDPRIWVGVIDTIPSSSRTPIPYDLEWQECNFSKKTYEDNYQEINPKSSPKREQNQRWFFVNGTEIRKQII